MTYMTNTQVLPLDDASVGMHLAESVLGEKGEVILSQGVALTEALLHALRRRGVTSLSVLGPDASPCAETFPTKDLQAQLARLEWLFRQDTGHSGAAHLRALLTRHRMEASS